MKILLTNDDSIESAGIREIAKQLAEVADVYIIAPKTPQSAGSHATTLHKPLRVEEFPLNAGEKISLRVSGTPSDCVVLGIDVLIKDDIDIVVSGINAGPNLGYDVIYSGTVAGAIEGAVNGKLSFAFSVDDFENPNFSFASKFASLFIKKVFDMGVYSNICFNVNIPNIQESEIKGVKFARLASRTYIDRVLVGKDPFNHDFYWIGGKLKDSYEFGTDSEIVKGGYIAVTPLLIDITDYKVLKEFSEIEFELPK